MGRGVFPESFGGTDLRGVGSRQGRLVGRGLEGINDRFPEVFASGRKRCGSIVFVVQDGVGGDKPEASATR